MSVIDAMLRQFQPSTRAEIYTTKSGLSPHCRDTTITTGPQENVASVYVGDSTAQT